MKTYSITGLFDLFTRKQIKDTLSHLGYKHTGSINEKTNFLVKGFNSGSKALKANDLSLEIMDETELLNVFKHNNIGMRMHHTDYVPMFYVTTKNLMLNSYQCPKHGQALFVTCYDFFRNKNKLIAELLEMEKEENLTPQKVELVYCMPENIPEQLFPTTDYFIEKLNVKNIINWFEEEYDELKYYVKLNDRIISILNKCKTTDQVERINQYIEDKDVLYNFSCSLHAERLGILFWKDEKWSVKA